MKRLEVDLAYTARDAVVMVPDVRFEEGEARFSIELQSLRGDRATGRLVCTCRSLSETIGREVVEMTLAGGSKTMNRTFAFPMGQHHMVDAEFQWIEPGLSIPPVSVGVSTVPTEESSTTIDRSSPIGMGIYLNRWRGDHRRKEMMQRLTYLARRILTQQKK